LEIVLREITLSEIQSLAADYKIFVRGRDYFFDGNVTELGICGDKITARVDGTAPDPYTIEIQVLDDDLAPFCSCPYGQEHDGCCKHTVATLFAYREGGEVPPHSRSRKETDDDVTLAAATIDPVLEKIALSPARIFLKSELMRDSSLRNRFLAFFGAYPVETPQAYQRKIEGTIKKQTQAGENTDLTLFEDQADVYARQGNIIEAAKIYRVLVEVSFRCIVETEDDGHEETEQENWGEENEGDYGDGETMTHDHFYALYDRASRSLVQCLKRADFDSAQRKEHIDALFKTTVSKKSAFHQAMLLKVIENAWSTLEDLDLIRELAAPHTIVAATKPIGNELEDRIAQADAKEAANGFIHTHAVILNHIADANPERREDAYRFLRQHRKDYSILKLLLERLTRDGRTAGAIKLAQDALSRHREHSEELHLTLDHLFSLTGDEEDRLDNMLALFLKKPSIAYYRKMKKNCPQDKWASVFTEAVHRLEAKPDDCVEPRHEWQGIQVRDKVLIDMLIAEGQYDCAAEKVLSRRQLCVLSAYRSTLAGKFPAKYAEGYRALVETFLNTHPTSHSTYKRAVSYLLEMSKIPGQMESARRFRDKLCTDHPTWHTFQEMLHKAL
jgi:hypothetical protein